MADSLREALSSAFDAAEPTNEEVKPSVPPVEEEAPVAASSESAPASDEQEGTDPPQEPVKAEQSEEKPEEKPETPAANKYDKPPGSWKPAAREKWATVDPEVRAEIYRRDAEVSRGISQYQADAKVGREFQEVVKPFEGTMRAAGVTPSQAIQSLLQTDHSLRFGTPVEKAQRVFEIMAFYGVSAEHLASVIDGTARQPEVPPEVAQLQARLAQLEQGRQVEQSRTVDTLRSEVDRFASDPANEFYRDVRDQMATLLEKGVARDLKDAYDQAVWANPETRKVLLQRQAAEQVQKVSQNAQRARAASSSIRSSGEPVKTSVDPGNLRAVLEAAWDSSGGRL